MDLPGGCEPSVVADGIRSGALPLREAFSRCWGFVEDADLWELGHERPWLAVRPDRRAALIETARRLETPQVEDLIALLAEEASAYLARLAERTRRGLEQQWDFGWEEHYPYEERRWREGRYYNPFWADLWLANGALAALVPPESRAREAVRIEAERFDWAGLQATDLCAPNHDERYQDDVHRIRLARCAGLFDHPHGESSSRSEHILRHCLDRTSAMRFEAIDALVYVAPEEALQVLTAIVRDPFDPVHGRAIFLLGDLRRGDSDAVAALVARVREPRAPAEDRWRAVVALGKIGSQQGLEAVLGYARDGSLPEQHRALIALGWIGGEAAERHLIGVLDDRGRSVHDTRSAALALARQRSEAGVAAVMRCMSACPGRLDTWIAAEVIANVPTRPVLAELRRYELTGWHWLYGAMGAVHERLKPGGGAGSPPGPPPGFRRQG